MPLDSSPYAIEDGVDSIIIGCKVDNGSYINALMLIFLSHEPYVLPRSGTFNLSCTNQ
jgi:hypothetical protein